MKIDIERINTWAVTFTNKDAPRATSVVRNFDTLEELIEYLNRLKEELKIYK